MTKPDDIPDEIWNTSGLVVLMQGFTAGAEVVEPIARAIMAEREAYDRRLSVLKEALRDCGTALDHAGYPGAADAARRLGYSGTPPRA